MIRFLLSAALGVLLGCVATAQTAPASHGMPRHPSLPAFCIPVKIGPHGPFLFGFDTGASLSTVTPELVKRLQVPVTGSAQITDASDSAHHSVATVRLSSLTTLGHAFPSLTAVVLPANEQGCSEPIYGTLGLSFFRDFLLTLDLQAGSVELARGSLTEADAHTVPYQAHPALPMVKIAVGPALLYAGVDTGGEFATILPTSVAKTLPLGPVLASGRLRTVAGQLSFKQAQLFGTLVLGGNDVPAPVISYSDHFPVAILGRYLLSNFLLTLDQKNQLVRIAPRTASP